MSRTFRVIHVFRKDLRRFWPLLLGLVGLLALAVAADPTTVVMGTGMPMALYSTILPALFGFLAVAVVHEDAASGRAFWVTRPLSPGAVLVSKLLFAGTFLVAVPVAGHVAWLIRNGGRGFAPWMATDAALHHGATLALVAAAAAVTTSLGRCLVLVVLGWGGISLVTGLAARGGVLLDPGVYETRLYITRIGWVVVGLALLAHQYRTRHAVRTIAFGVVAMVALTVGVQRSRADWTVGPIADEDRYAFADPTAVGMRLVTLELEERGPLIGVSLRATLSPSPQPVVYLDPVRVGTRILGPEVDRRFGFETASRSFASQSQGPTAVVGLSPASGAARPRSGAVFVQAAHWVPDEIGDDPFRGAERLEIEATFDVLRPEPLGTLPLETGAELRTSQGTYTIRDVTRSPRSVIVDVGAHWVDPALSAQGRIFSERTRVVLVNRRYGEFLDPAGRSGGGYGLPGLLGGSRITAWPTEVTFTPNPSWDLPADWLEEAELLVVGARYDGTFTRTIERRVDTWPVRGERVQLDGPWPVR